MIKTKGMEKNLITVGIIAILFLFTSCTKSVLSGVNLQSGQTNKPIEIRLNSLTRVCFDLDQADVVFYSGNEENILITYEPEAFDTAPDYSLLEPQIKTIQKELNIKLKPTDRLPRVNIYIPSSVEQLTIRHEKGSLHFNDDITTRLAVNGNQSDIKINYIESLLNINVSEGNITVLNGNLPEGSNITVKIGNISVHALLEKGDHLFSTGYGNIDFRSNASDIALSALGYIRLNEFPVNRTGSTFVTLDSKVGFISACADF